MATETSLFLEAQAAYTKGDLPSVERLLSQILESDPNHVESIVLFGVLFARRGRRQEAIDHLERAVLLEPRCFEAHVALSTLLFADGHADRAIRHGEQAIALQPTDPDAFHHLARDLVAHGRTEEAIPHFRRALKLAPGHPRFVQDLAAALTELGQLAEAMDLWKNLTQRYPQVQIGWLKLGGMHLASRNFQDAIRCGEKAVMIDPKSADARILLGLAYLGNQDAPGAETHLARALVLRPGELVTQSAYGLALVEMGRFDEARPHFESALEICPTNGQAYHSLLRTRKVTAQDAPLLDQLIGHLHDNAASVIDRSYMHYALGKAREDLGEYETAMENYDQATELARQAWFSSRLPDRTRYSKTIQATIDTLTPELIGSLGRDTFDSEKPLFVVGMIRSGTTLVEQIISSHPNVKGAGELTYWHDEAGKIFDPDRGKINEKALRQTAAGYLDLLERLGPGFARVTDKLPHNYSMLGFVLAAIPGARVVYVKRDPVDNCLSIFTTAYQHPPAFTLNRADIVFNYREHERIMNHWRAVLPAKQFMEVSYEEVVQDREAATRRLIDFAGLPWSDDCLYPERNTRTVNTPSVWQVRQPVYKTSLERWRKFEPWLGEFRDLVH